MASSTGINTYFKGRVFLELLIVRSGLSNLTTESIYSDLETFVVGLL